MKKILAWLLTAAMALSQLTAVAFAEDAWAPTATSYTADFTNSAEVSKWQCATGTQVPTVSNGALNWSSSKDTVYMLPVAKLSNFVLEMDLTNVGGDNYFAVNFGLDDTGSNWSKRRIRFLQKYSRNHLNFDGSTTISRYTSENVNNYKWNSAEALISDAKQTSKIRVVVYNNRLAAWRNDQLVYTYTLDSTYAGGYIGIEFNYYGAVIRALSVREATASDLVLAESFNEPSKIGMTEKTAFNKLSTNGYGAGTLALQTNTIVYVDSNQNVVGDHVFSSGLSFGSTSNGPTRYIGHIFGANVDSETGLMSGYLTVLKVDGTIQVGTVSETSKGIFTTKTLKTISSGAATRALFLDKSENAEMTTDGKTANHDVLMLDEMWEYRHVLKDGTIYIYLDDVLMGSYANDAFKGLTGFTGIYTNGFASKIQYIGVRGVESADLNRPNQFKVRVADESGSYTALANKIVRFYTSTTVDNVATEELYGTAYADKDGAFDIHLGHNQTYIVKVFNGNEEKPIATKSIKYTHTGAQTNIDFDEVIYYTELADIDFVDNAAVDSSAKSNTLVLYEQAKTEAMDAFGGKEALVLDGVGDAARFESAAAFELDDKDKLTVEAVFIPRERDGIKEMAVIGGTMGQFSGKKNGFGLYVDQNTEGKDVISFRATVGDEHTLYEVDALCEMNTAYYAAGVYDGTAMRLYINGVEAASKTVAGDICTITTLAPAIGAEWYNLNDLRKYFFKGEIADVYIANGIKTADEIAETYNNYTAAGYQLGEEAAETIETTVSFSNEAPQKGDTVTVTATLRNTTDSAKTVTVKIVPGYFAALTSGENEQEITIPANSIAAVEVSYKLLEGGREPFRAYVYESGAVVSSAVKSLSVIGAGYYKSETHNHSTRSDGTNTFEENVLEGFTTKNLSYAFATEHNQYNYWNYKKAEDTSARYNPQQFKVFMGAEFTSTQSHANVYELTNDVSTQENNVNKPDWNEAARAYCFDLISENGVQSAIKYNAFIDTIENETGGGYLYINHPSDRTYYTPDDIIKDLRGYTGIEVWNGAQTCFDEVTLKQRDTWDKANSIGWGHIVGQAGTDAHGAVCYGTIQKVAYLDELSLEEITRVVADGNAISTNGPEIRFDINGVAMNATAVVTDSKAAFDIDVYDPMGDIEEVKLIKNKVSGEFTTENRTETVIYKKAEGAAAISVFSYNEILDVSEGEFYRVEVTTAKTPYGSLSSNGTTTPGEGSGKGWAFTNNIWITETGTSNSTNISAIASESDNVALCELPTGIMYLEGGGEFSLDELNVTADGKVSKAAKEDAIMVTVTAADGTQSATEIYLVGDITVSAETKLVCGEAQCTDTTSQVNVTVIDGQGLLSDNGAKLIVAVYNESGLIGCNIEDVNSEDKEKSMTVTYTKQADMSKVSVKAMLMRDMNNIVPLCDAENVVIKAN